MANYKFEQNLKNAKRVVWFYLMWMKFFNLIWSYKIFLDHVSISLMGDLTMTPQSTFGTFTPHHFLDEICELIHLFATGLALAKDDKGVELWHLLIDFMVSSFHLLIIGGLICCGPWTGPAENPTILVDSFTLAFSSCTLVARLLVVAALVHHDFNWLRLIRGPRLLKQPRARL